MAGNTVYVQGSYVDVHDNEVVNLSIDKAGEVKVGDNQQVRDAEGIQAVRQNGAEGQRDVIDHDQDVVECNLLFLHPIADRLTAEVHIGRWLEQNQLLVLDAHLRHSAIAL